MSPKDELANLTRLLEALESGDMTLKQGHVDVTEREIQNLKPDIEYLKTVLKRSSGQ